MIQIGGQRFDDTLNGLAAHAERRLEKYRFLFLGTACLAYMAFTIVGYPCCGISVMLPSILLCGLATGLYNYRIGLLVSALSQPFNMLVMMYHLDNLQGWHSGLEPGGFAAQLIAVLCIAVAKSNRKKTLELTANMENRIRQRTKELQEITEYIINHAEAERARVSEKLCDIVNHQLTGLLYHSETLMNFLTYTDAPQAVDAVKLVRIAEQNIEQVENLTRKLSLQTIMEAGIKQTLHEMCADLEETTGTRFSVNISDRHREIPRQIALPIYRIAHETVTNALRHGRASHIGIHLELDDETLSLTIINDGLPMPDSASEGLGLKLIRQRAENISANIQYDSEKSRGTIFKCVLNRKTDTG